MLDKAKFWKKKEPELEKELVEEPISQEPEPTPGIPEFGTGMQQEQPVETEKPNMELINSKLDAIKSELDSVNLRIKNIEKIAQAEERKQKIWK